MTLRTCPECEQEFPEDELLQHFMEHFSGYRFYHDKKRGYFWRCFCGQWIGRFTESGVETDVTDFVKHLNECHETLEQHWVRFKIAQL